MSEIDWEKGQMSAPATPADGVDWEKGDIKAPLGPKGFVGHARDLGISALQGAIAVPEAAVGLADIPTGGAAGKFLENKDGMLGFRPKEAHAALSDLNTDQYKDQQQQFHDADGVLAKTGVALSNPSLIVNPVVESAPSMGFGGVIGRGAMAVAPKLISSIAGAKNASALAGSIGEGATMAGSQAEGIRQQTEDGNLTAGQSAAAASTGVLGTLFGYAGGRLANKLGIGDVDTMLAGGVTPQQIGSELASTPAKSIPRKVIEGAIHEGFLEELPQSFAEQVLQNLALDKPWSDGVDEAVVMGTLAGMAMGGPAGAMHGGSHAAEEAPAKPAALALPAPTIEVGPDGQALTSADRNAAIQAESDKQDRIARGDIQDVTPIPQADQGQREPLRLPAPVIEVGPNGEALTSADRNTEIAGSLADDQAKLEAEAARQSRIARGEVLDITPIPKAPTESQAMGLDPAAGPMSGAAALAVDSGAHKEIAKQTLMQEASDATQENAKKSDSKGKTPDLFGGSSVDPETGEITAPKVDPAQRATDLTTKIEYLRNLAKGSGWTPRLLAARQAAEAELGTIQPKAAEATAAPTSVAEGIKKVRAQKVAAAQEAIATPTAPLAPPQTEIVNGKQTAQAQQASAQRTQAPGEVAAPATAAKAAAEPAAGIATPVSPAAPNIEEAGNTWATMSKAQRQAIADKTDLKGVLRRNIVNGEWKNMGVGVKAKLAEHIQVAPAEKPKKLSAKKQAEAKQQAISDHFTPGNIVTSYGGHDRVISYKPSDSSGQASIQVQSVQKVGDTWQDVPGRPPHTHSTIPTDRELKAGPVVRAPSHIDAAAHEAATSPLNDRPEPTEAQKEAGNYAKGHVRVAGMDIAIENPRGSERKGKRPDGSEWSHEMSDHYGYIKRTTGADGEHVDTYIGSNPESSKVYVVDQLHQDSGKFDEHKVMLGFDSHDDAVKAYSSNFDKGWKVGQVTEMSTDDFKQWLADGDTTKPLGAASNSTESEQEPPKAASEPAKSESEQAKPASRSPVREQAEPAAKAESIQDFGEKIGGARKDKATTGVKKAAKSTDERPAWQRRFQISEIVSSTKTGEAGRWSITDTKRLDAYGNPRKMGSATYATEAEAQEALPLLAVAQKHRVVPVRQGDGTGFEIWRDVSDRKRVKVVDQVFDTREAAMEYMAKNAEAIIDTNTTFGEADLPRPENTIRTGSQRRTGPAKDSDFMKTFGFRGVEFGNWNNQEERQQLLDDAYDGLLDLAEVMGIPPNAISLNGDLALAFGARGQGLSGARAHYERSKAVINLTKMNGAGSLAHEWFHALDHYFGRQDGKASSEWVTEPDGTRSLKTKGREDDYASHGFNYKSSVRPEVREAYTSLMQTMFKKGEQYVEDTAKVDNFVARSRKDVGDRLDELRRDLAEQKDPKYWKRNNKPATTEQLAEFDTVAQQILDGTMLETDLRSVGKPARNARSVMSGMRWTNDALEKLSEINKAVRGRTGFSADGKGEFDRLRGLMNGYSARLKMLSEAQSGEEKTKKVPTEFAMNAKELDQGRGGDYWTTPHEMAARAFQGYVEDKVAEGGGKSPFLNHAPENAAIITPWGWKRPYPHDSERKAINAAFDKLVNVLETKQGDNGNTILFSRSGAAKGDVTGTPAFKRWFGSSKVVDDQGKPLVVYHGTTSNFSNFSSEFIGEGHGAADWGDGFYFTDTPAAANTYAEGEGGNVMPSYLKIENPATNEVMMSKEVQDALDDGMGFDEVSEVLAELGHDGIVITHKGGEREYIAFKPEQIKSATGNNGQFDPANTDIRYSFAGKNAEGADLHSLASAQQQVNAGYDSERVRQDTGWHRGNDGRWRYEISDKDAALKPEGQNFGSILASAAIDASTAGKSAMTVGDLLDHPRLFAAYPELANIRIAEMPPGETATAKVRQTAVGPLIMVQPNLKRDAIVSAVTHELQHEIQRTEGFARGGSKKSTAEWNQNGAADYKRLAGEVEARNTQSRLRMTDEQRAAVAPEFTSDIAGSDVIVTFNGKDVVNAPKPENIKINPKYDMNPSRLVRAFDVQFPSLTPAIRKMLARGNKGEKGGVVVIQSDDPVQIAKTFAQKTGRSFSDSVQMFSEAGKINGFYDPKSGLTFLVGPNINPVTGTAVLLHEMTHGQQREKIDNAALAMLMNRSNEKDEALRGFLDRVAERMVDAGEAANAQEAAAYIVEQAVIEGRDQGHAFADSRFLSWVDSNLGKKVGDFLRSFVANVRQFMLRNGMPIAGQISVDDLVEYAKAGVQRAAQGDVKSGVNSGVNASRSAGEKPLTEAQFYRQYAQHVDIRGRGDQVKSESTRQSILSDGFKKGMNVNGLPPYQGGKPQNVIQARFAPKAGDMVYLAPKGSWKVGGNGIEIQDGWLPKPYEAIRVTSDHPSMYQEYLKAFAEHQQGQSSSSDVTSTPAFKKWFGDSKVVDDQGKPLVVYHGTGAAFNSFDTSPEHQANDEGMLGKGHYFTTERGIAELYAKRSGGKVPAVIEVYLSAKNPLIIKESSAARGDGLDKLGDLLNEIERQVSADDIDLRLYPILNSEFSKGRGGIIQSFIDGNSDQAASEISEFLRDNEHDSVIYEFSDGEMEILVLDPGQIKSATGNNGQFDPANPDIRFSRSGVKALASKATAELNKTFNAPGKLSWWHKTIGSMYNLAERAPAFKPVFEAAQNFIDDVSYYAADASDLAPKWLPKLETWKDITKSPVSAEDNKAVGKPIFEGTLVWARDLDGTPVRVESLAERAANLTTEEKADIMIAQGKLPQGLINAWRGQGAQKFAELIDSRYESQMLKAGIVWTDAELKSMFKLNDDQVGLYHEFRDATNRSLDTMARADMIRYGGDDVKEIREAVMDATDVQAGARMLRDHLVQKAQEQPDREAQLMATANGMMERADKVTELQDSGYAPLSRFGKYTVDVVVDGERQYFSLFETQREANTMAERMRKEFGEGTVSQGTLSDESYKLFAGITPESLELFGNMLGLKTTGDNAQDQVFQEYLRLTKTNRSAMRRLIHRQGIAGFSEDVGRVLASFVYSNARQTAAGLHMGDMSEAITNIPKEQGELKDVAVRLSEYIKNPQEEAQAVRGLLFAQYLGGSIASAFVNMTQPIAVTFPWLSQYGGARNAASQLGKAAKQMSTKGFQYEKDLAQALHDAEEDGTVSPQEVHQLMAQARGAGSLRSGDGTKIGDARAAASNTLSRLSVAWGKVFGAAEQVNRRVTFIAAYRTAKEQGIENPADFARRAVKETQFVYSKASKMAWGRGAVGGTLMTFKTYSIAYLELLHRMATQGGPEGKKAAALALGVMMLMGGAGGLPFEEDVEDAAEGLAQLLGYNISAKKARQDFLESIFGKAAADIIDKGVSGLPGMPLDVSGRLGMQNLIPGTGLLKEKTDHSKDILEIAGPAGDFASRLMSGAKKILTGDVGGGLLDAAPTAVRNAAKGVDMAATGSYRDAKGYKVLDTNMLEAALKSIGFQPNSVATVQEANGINQQKKGFYTLTAQDISAKWAAGLHEKDPEMVKDARAMITDWNEKNPDQPMRVSIPGIIRRAREMSKSKDERIADTAPKAMRAQMKQDVARVRSEL